MAALDLKRLPPALRRAIWRGLTLAGVAFLVAAGLQAGASLKTVRNGQHFEGQVVEFGKQRFVQFERPEGQTTFRPEGLFLGKPGDKTPVILDPLRPGTPPVAATLTVLWLKPAALLLVGGALFAFAFPRMERKKR
jgi:hypothetical protein